MTMTMDRTNSSDVTRAQWSVILFKDERTTDLTYEFTFPNGHGGMASKELGIELSFKEMARQLAQRTTALPRNRGEAATFIEDLIASEPAKLIIKAEQPGWRSAPENALPDTNDAKTAFVTPGQIIGLGRANYRWFRSPGGHPHIGQVVGGRKGWQVSVGSLALQSNYISFAIMAHLAGPLLTDVELPEDPVFNWVGPSSVGKTTGVRAGASAVGHPDTIRSWDMTERGLEDASAAYNHLTLVLNAAEKVTPRKRRAILNRIVHMVAERESTTRSEAVQGQLPNRTWRTCVLSTSNKTGAEMAAELGIPWEPQDAARFIDIPVPPAEEGGIFDRLMTETNAAKAGAELIANLETALPKNYGVLLEPWIGYLLTIDVRKEVARYIRRFLKKTGPHSALEARIAKKVALVYAAGKLAIKAGLLTWPSGHPLSVTKTLLVRAKELRELGDRGVTGALTALTEAIDDPTRVKSVVLGKVVEVHNPDGFLGVRYTQGGKRLVGIRKEGLPALVGADLVEPLLRRLAQLGALRTGHGDKSTQQLALTIKLGSKTLAKPRFLVIDPSRLSG
jgi:hypothetical protein